MSTYRLFAVPFVGLLLSGCSTILEGTSQEIAIASSPPGANCVGDRVGERVIAVQATPATVTVRKTKENILLTCSLAGHHQSTQYLNSGIATGTYGNIIAGGLIGWGIDSATGADNKYPEAVNVQMIPASQPAPPPAQPQAAPTS